MTSRHRRAAAVGAAAVSTLTVAALLAPTTGAVPIGADTAAASATAPDAAGRIDRTPAAQMQGAGRFRDVAGSLTTADGRPLRTGVAYRSNDLSRMTDADRALLTDLGVSLAVDLRAVTERAERPEVRLPAGTRYLLADMSSLEHGIAFAEPLPATLARALGTGSVSGSAGFDTGDIGQWLAYTMMASFSGTDHGLGTMLRALAAEDGATVYFCIGGKDRTGWASAVLLTVLGVPRDQIEADFLRDHDTRGLDRPVQLDWLDAAYATVDAAYGDFDTYLRRGLGLDQATLDALRAKLIA